MLNFSQFCGLCEAFWKGIPGSFEYTEVYKNPTPSEISEITNGSSMRQLAGIVSGKDFYIWDRDKAEHSDVKYLIPDLDREYLPIYCKYRSGTRELSITISTYSWRGGWDYDEEAIRDSIKKLPAFKAFKVTR